MSLNTRVCCGRSCKNYKGEFGTTLVSIITISHYQVHVFSKMFLWKETALQVRSVFHSLAELLPRMKLKLSAILSGKAQRLLHGSISNSLTGTHTNKVARGM